MRILEDLIRNDEGERLHYVSSQGLCELWGISSGMLSKLTQRDIAVRMGHDSYDLVSSTQRYVEHLRGVASGRGGDDQVTNLTSERARLAKEQADHAAIKNEKLRGELVDASDVERIWGDTLRQVRARIMAVPSRLRSELVGIDGRTTDAMDKALRVALGELGNADD